MNEFKYQIVQFLFLILLGLGAYWALTHLDTGVSYSRDQVIEDIQEIEPVNPDQVVNAVNSETVLVAEEVSTETDTDTNPVPDATETVAVTSNSVLISDLQKLVDDNAAMDSGANGSRVGTVQKFLDEYFTDRVVSVDNDFGPTTKRLVKEFQQKELNGGDGRIGPNTLKAMIEYLK